MEEDQVLVDILSTSLYLYDDQECMSGTESTEKKSMRSGGQKLLPDEVTLWWMAGVVGHILRGV